jgi:hypothetical protein
LAPKEIKIERHNMDDEITRNLKHSALKLGSVAFGLEHFSSRILAHAIRANAIDSQAIESIKARSIADLKDSHFTGLSMEQEVDIIREAIDDLEKLMHTAISRAWEGD